MSELRKLSNHSLLLRYNYQYEDLPDIAKKLAADPNYKDTVVQYIVDDLACMSDFEIHTLTKQYKVRPIPILDGCVKVYDVIFSAWKHLVCRKT